MITDHCNTASCFVEGGCVCMCAGCSFKRGDDILSGREDLRRHLYEAEEKAWTSLARYKFQMFGYWAAIWVHLNRIGKFKRKNPWRVLVKAARAEFGP